MLYLGNASSPSIRAAIAAGALGQLCSPRERRSVVPGAWWAADNGCYGTGYPGHPAWLAWLRRHAALRSRCLFATAPDVVGDARATLARSRPWLPMLRTLDYPPALVAQDGLEDLDVPWPSFDVLFVGGTTEWKLSAAAADLVAEAHAQGKRVHLGRVNSLRRLQHAAALGCHTVDGTYLAFGPDKNLQRLLRWLHQLDPGATHEDPRHPGRPAGAR